MTETMTLKDEVFCGFCESLADSNSKFINGYCSLDCCIKEIEKTEAFVESLKIENQRLLRTKQSKDKLLKIEANNAFIEHAEDIIQRVEKVRDAFLYIMN